GIALADAGAAPAPVAGAVAEPPARGRVGGQRQRGERLVALVAVAGAGDAAGGHAAQPVEGDQHEPAHRRRARAELGDGGDAGLVEDEVALVAGTLADAVP